MRLFLASLLLAAAPPAVAASNTARAEFKRTHPCPGPGGSCVGYELDRRVPLCAGGQDEAGNYQWLKAGEAREKGRRDAAACREEYKRAERARDAERVRAGGANGGGG